MEKLYNKNEILFAILLILIYVLGASFSSSISNFIGIKDIVNVPFFLIYSIVLFLWIKKYKRNDYYGLIKPKVKSSKLLFYIPLIILCSCNIWFGIHINMNWYESLIYIFNMLFVGFLEELIFRGFLFKAMEKDNLKVAIIVSSLTFGIGHIINLFNGNAINLITNIAQIVSAIAFGFLFVIIFLKTKSIIPCILTHSFINMLSVFSYDTTLSIVITSLILIFLTSLYAFYISKIDTDKEDLKL